MAAKLKKRALAEYGSQVLTEERTEPIKRLKLSSRHSASSDIEIDPVLNIDSNTSEKRIVSELMKYNRYLKLSSSDNLETSIRRIEDCLKRLKDNSVKYKLILALAKILASGKIQDIQDKLTKIVDEVGKESSNKLRSAWLQAAHMLAEKKQLDRGQSHQLYEAARQSLLGSSNPQVHIQGLSLVSSLVRQDSQEINTNISTLVSSYSMSQDARVRSAAFRCLRHMHEVGGVKLDVSVYPLLCSAIRDDYEGVRMEVMKIMCLLSDVHPEYQVKLDDDAGYNRLVDDVFSRICQVINDVREPVRCLAAQLIGKMSQVSQTFLEQTLDKKLMSNMRVKKSQHERQAGLVNSGEWSSGKKWADDSPKEELSSEAVSLVSFGSCGAFVHGLEDECYSVRVAAVDSLTNLSIENHNLAVLALDFLVDMFNDEIEQVRFKAIESLTAIAKHIKLQVHQLDVILAALDDYSTLLREKLHGMLQACNLATKDGLKSVINKLMANLKKYPQDKRSILLTFKHLGANHPDLTLPLVTSLLHIHPFFDTPEPDIEDPGYMCTLVLVLNAAQHCPTLPLLLDQHTKRHHAYLEDTFPHLIPSSADADADSTSDSLPTEAAEFMTSVLQRVNMCRNMSSTTHVSILNASCSELERISNVQESISDPATFARLYMESQALYEKIVRSSEWSNKTSQPGHALRTNIQRLLMNTKKLNSMFSKLDAENTMLIRILKVKSLAVNLVSVVCNSNKSAKSESDEFLREFESLLMDIPDSQLPKYKFIDSFNSLALTESKSGQLARQLKPLLLQHPPAGLQSVPLDVKQARAVINEPTGGSETSMKCLAGLVLGIRMDSELINIQDPSLIRICIRTADQVKQLTVPKRGDLVNVGGQNYRLLTEALLSLQVWSESLDVEISLVLELGSKDNLVPLSQTVKVSVLPKPVRRGI